MFWHVALKCLHRCRAEYFREEHVVHELRAGEEALRVIEVFEDTAEGPEIEFEEPIYIYPESVVIEQRADKPESMNASESGIQCRLR